jgi:hypothetical protein
MNPKFISAAALLLISLVHPGAQAQNRPVLRGATNGTIGPKAAIEGPLENFIRTESGPTSLLKTSGVPSRKPLLDRPLPTSIGNVRPGLVAWLPDFGSALKASAQTGKPVLLFQMMGKLDDEFC